MKVVVADPEVAELVRERGGRLYVWATTRRCCSGGMTYLSTSTEPPRDHAFRPIHTEGFEIWFDIGHREAPDELVLDARGWRRRRVDAFWNGCALVL